jgi:hypothetical protein
MSGMVSPLGSPRASLALERARTPAPAAGPAPELDEADLEDLAAFTVPEPRGARATTGERIARRFFALCENPRTRDRMMRGLRSSAASAVGGRLMVALLSRTVLPPLLKARKVDDAAATVELVAAQLGGIAVLRYVTRMEPIASMPVDDLVELVAPGIQATLAARRGRSTDA